MRDRYYAEIDSAADAIALMEWTGELATIKYRRPEGLPRELAPRPIAPWYPVRGDDGATLYVHPENQRRVVAVLDAMPPPNVLYSHGYDWAPHYQQPLSYCAECGVYY